MSDIRIYLKSVKYGERQTGGTYFMTYFKDEWREPPVTQENLERQSRRRSFVYVNRTRTEAYLLCKALKELEGKCRIWVYTELEPLWGIIYNYIPIWKEQGWKKSKGMPVEQEYIDLAEKLRKHELKELIIGKHEYSDDLELEIHNAVRVPDYGKMIRVEI